MCRLFFAGDFCSRDPNSIKISPRLQKLMDSCDLRVLNFEGPLHKGPLSITNKNILPQSEESPKWCIDNNFNIVSLANNHALDFGEHGLQETIKAFDSIVSLGAGFWDEAYSIKTKKIGGNIVGFLAATSSDLASFKDKWTDANRIGCANLMTSEIERVVETKHSHCDFLILIAHAGIEYCNVPLPELRDRYRRLIELGADAIVAMHPHVPQGSEVYKGKPIIYSLGNYFFDRMDSSAQLHKLWQHGLCVIIDFNIQSEKKYELIPISSKDGILDMEQDKNILSHIDWLSKVLENDNYYMDTVNKEVKALYPVYKDWLFRGFNVYEADISLRSFYHFVKGCNNKPNYRSALHQIREESTRWLLTRYLKNESNSIL